MSEYLISKRARINVKDRNGKTPLYYATKSNNHKIIKVILIFKSSYKITVHDFPISINRKLFFFASSANFVLILYVEYIKLL